MQTEQNDTGIGLLAVLFLVCLLLAIVLLAILDLLGGQTVKNKEDNKSGNQ
jgi:hypothetical protein